MFRRGFFFLIFLWYTISSFSIFYVTLALDPAHASEWQCHPDFVTFLIVALLLLFLYKIERIIEIGPVIPELSAVKQTQSIQFYNSSKHYYNFTNHLTDNSTNFSYCINLMQSFLGWLLTDLMFFLAFTEAVIVLYL